MKCFFDSDISTLNDAEKRNFKRAKALKFEII